MTNTGHPGPGSEPVGQDIAAATDAARPVPGRGLLAGFGRDLGLVIALGALVLVGLATTGERFFSVANLLVVLQQARSRWRRPTWWRARPRSP